MSPNSSHRFDRPLRVELRASRLLRRAGLLLYPGAALSSLCLPLHAAWCAALWGVLGLNFLLVYRRHIAASAPTAIDGLAWDARRAWRIRGPQGDWRNATLCTPVFVSYRLAVARFRSGRWFSRSVIVVPDRLDREQFRRLRVRLIQSAHGDRDRTEISGQG
jgi:hypothetical protein